jgi:hypothetical protein
MRHRLRRSPQRPLLRLPRQHLPLLRDPEWRPQRRRWPLVRPRFVRLHLVFVLPLEPCPLRPDSPLHMHLAPRRLQRDLELHQLSLQECRELYVLERPRQPVRVPESLCVRKRRGHRVSKPARPEHLVPLAPRLERRAPAVDRLRKASDIRLVPVRLLGPVNSVPVRRKVHVRERHNNFVRQPERKADPVLRVRAVLARRRRVFRSVPVVRVDATTKLPLARSAQAPEFRKPSRASHSMRASLPHAAVRSWRSATPKASASCIRFARALAQVRVVARSLNRLRRFTASHG